MNYQITGDKLGVVAYHKRMTLFTCTGVRLSLYRRDASYYVTKVRRPAVREVNDLISHQLRNTSSFFSTVEIDVPRDIAERFVRLNTKPFPLPVSNRSLRALMLQALNEQERRTTVGDEDEVVPMPAAPTDVSTMPGEDTTDEPSLADVIGPDDAITTQQHESADEDNVPGDSNLGETEPPSELGEDGVPVLRDSIDPEATVIDPTYESDVRDYDVPVESELETHSQEPDQEPTPVADESEDTSGGAMPEDEAHEAELEQRTSVHNESEFETTAADGPSLDY